MASTPTVTDFTRFVEERSHCVTLGSGHASSFAETLGISLEMGILTEMYLRLQYTRLSHLSVEEIKEEYFNGGIKNVATEHLDELKTEFNLIEEIREMAKLPIFNSDAIEGILKSHKGEANPISSLTKFRDHLRLNISINNKKLKRKQWEEKKFLTAQQVLKKFSTHPEVKIQKVGKGLYGIFAKGNPEWSEPEWSCMARYDRTALLEWANRFFPLSACPPV